jgi:hypothetical protein
MDIKRAKKEIEDAVRAYLIKDDNGAYRMDVVRQRPILLIGPPGIGKSAIISQAAGDLKIGLVAYTMTHHTRQSIMGLPFIHEEELGGHTENVTEYTMSEIIADIYRKIDETNVKEGILFLDEINCVSETLAPVMLMLLQNKRFGNEAVPAGWVIVAAGNPPEYNNSVHDFDVVTLDRMRRIDIEADFSAFKEYALNSSLYPAILSYLNIKQDNFYSIKTTVDGRRFVTARGWEDLSSLLYAYDELGLKVDEKLVFEYLQDEKTASDFSNFLELYSKYRSNYDISDIISGNFLSSTENVPEGTADQGHAVQPRFLKLAQSDFDERYSIIELLVSSVINKVNNSAVFDSAVKKIYDALVKYKTAAPASELHFTEKNPSGIMTGLYDYLFSNLSRMEKLQPDETEKKSNRLSLSFINDLKNNFQSCHPDPDTAIAIIRSEFASFKSERISSINDADSCIFNCLNFLDSLFGVSHEAVLFVTDLTLSASCMAFLTAHGDGSGAKSYFSHNSALLMDNSRSRILNEIEHFSI